MTTADKIIEMYKEGLSTYQICEKLKQDTSFKDKVYPNKISRILKKNGIKLRTKSEAQKQALASGEAIHPTEGRERTDAEKINISKGGKEHWDDMDEEERERRSIMSKQNWQKKSPEEIAKMQKKAAEAISRTSRQGSKLEREIAHSLVENGYDVDYHQKHLIGSEALEIDIYLPELNVAVEVDGISHFEPVWGEDKLRKQQRADREKNGLLLRNGKAVIRLKQRKKNLSLYDQEALKERLLEALKPLQKRLPPKAKRLIEIEL